MLRTEVILIDDQTVLRELLVEVLRNNPRYVVLGDHESGRQGLEHCLKVRPQLVVLDVVLPDISGLDVLRRLRDELPNTRVVVITAHDKLEIVQQALDLGAHGLVMKGAPLHELLEALDRVASGRTYYCSQTAQRIRELALSPRAATSPLTPRQREILIRVASGQSTKHIAEALGLSAKTVSNHRQELMRRLGLHDVASLTRYAVERGLVEARAADKGSS